MTRKTKSWRAWEILPGAIVWTLIISPFILAFAWPSLVALGILIYDLFWVFRALYMATLMARASQKMRHALRCDYSVKLKSLPKDDTLIAPWRSLCHVVIFATFGEELDILEPSCLSVVEAQWPNQQKIIVLAGEERDRERLMRVGGYLKQKYGDKVYDFLIFEHPDGIAGEVRGKGAGADWAGRRFSDYVAKKGLKEEETIVTIADADTRFPRQFFNAVSYEFVINANRHRRTYQPIPLYSNNIWQATAISRLTAWGSSFWQMMQASRPWRMTNFATHAYSLKMLREMDYWAVDVVNEDSRQFWRAYFAFDGDHKVVPVYLPIHMDAVFAQNYWITLKNQYLQKRRWAYGIEHFPYIVTESFKNKKIPWIDKGNKILTLLFDTVMWSTASFYLTVVGLLPIIFSDAFRHTVLAYNLPTIARAMLSVTWIALFYTAYTSLIFPPPKPPHYKRFKYVGFALEWIITPVSAVLFGSIPAFEAQSRFMLGKYLTFWVTPKITTKK